MSDIEGEHARTADEERTVEDDDFVAEAAELDEGTVLTDPEAPRVDVIEQHLEVPLPDEEGRDDGR
jgi:hypothetical protein